MSNYFPVEVILEILRRLPVKSLVKCRSVCRTWNSLIKNPSFISTHLQTSLSTPNTPLLLLSVFRNDREQYFVHFDNDDFDEFKQLLFPFDCSWPSRFKVVGSSNGIVCLESLFPRDPAELILWNPSIQKYITLPDPNPNPIELFGLTFGFGYDSKSNDFKLIRINSTLIDHEILNDVDLFSLNGYCWKKVNASPIPYNAEPFHSSIFANGAMHWLGNQIGKDVGHKIMVLGFDISSEEFFVINLPEILVDSYSYEALSVMKYEETSIAVLKTWWRYGEEIDIWVMKEYGVVGSWTKVVHLTYQSAVSRVLGFRNKGEVLLVVNVREIASLNLNSQQMQYLGIDGERPFSFVGSYVESLVLLDKEVDTRNMIRHIIE